MKPIVYTSVTPAYWPTEGWQTSAPEEQGMYSDRLLEMSDAYKKAHLEDENTLIDSITIVRKGYIVADMYFNPLYSKDSMHITHSVTKSVMEADSNTVIVLHFYFRGYSTRDEWRLTFDGNRIHVEEKGVTGAYEYEEIIN